MTGGDTLLYEERTQVALAPDTALIARAVDSLRHALASQGAPDQTLDAIRLGVTEALTNAIRHGRCPPDRAEVKLAWRWVDEWLVIDITEPGHFDPPADWTQLPADPLCEGGRGGFLIAGQFDELQHLNAHGRHTLRLRKRLGPPRFSAAIAAELDKTLTAMTEDLSASYETLSALFRLAEALATTENLAEFVPHALRLRTLVDADTMHVRLRDDGERLVLLGHEGDGVPPPRTIAAGGDSREAAMFRARTDCTIDERTRLAADDPLRGLEGVGFICPVHFQSRALGVCVLTRRRREAFFTAAQLSLARTTAEFLGIACANAEFQAQRRAQLRAQRELEIAAQIQQSLVPTTFPRRQDWLVAGACINALEAGGDFFDVLEVDGGVLLVIADVMGKGVPAALLALVLRTAVRAHAARAPNPGELLNCVSAQVAPDLLRIGMFITAQVVFLAENSPHFAYANAGHGPLAIIARDAAGDHTLDEGGLPLGVSGDERYMTHGGQLATGDRLLLVTDGITESPDESGAELGLAGLLKLARAAGPDDLAGMCAHLLVELKQRDHGRAADDDRTLLAVERVS